MQARLANKMTNKNEVTPESKYTCTMMEETKVMESRAGGIFLDMDTDNQIANPDTIKAPTIQHQTISYRFPISTYLKLNANRADNDSSQCDLVNLQALNLSKARNNLGDSRTNVHLSAPPKIDNFRRPSLPSSYYPIPHHSPARVPYKRATSNPLYLPTDKDYYPNNIIAQRCRRRRSTTPPFKEYKHFPSKFNHSHPPNVSYKIWSIPREVGIHLYMNI